MRDVPITNRQVWWLAFEASLTGCASDAAMRPATIVAFAMKTADEAVLRYKDAEVNR
jgi:hypothetical protein